MYTHIKKPKMSDGFGHIYFDDWQLGATCYRKLNGEIKNLGVVVSKELVGRVYDPDIKITFAQPEGRVYEHIIDFDSSYKLVVFNLT